MTNTEIQHLVSMANDIAVNLSFRDDADVHIADHINRFWAPRMRKLLLDHAAADGQELSEELRTALKRIKGQ